MLGLIQTIFARPSILPVGQYQSLAEGQRWHVVDFKKDAKSASNNDLSSDMKSYHAFCASNSHVKAENGGFPPYLMHFLHDFL